MSAVYEVKNHGVSLYTGLSLTEAQDSFKKSGATGETFLYRIVNSQKHVLQRK